MNITPKESKQISTMTTMIQAKEFEVDMLKNGYRDFINQLIKEKNLDPNKKWKIVNDEFVEDK